MKSTDTSVYRVLARKYRPRHFDELIGQEALVRTLRNAIDKGRVAHAFMLTGVRGVGKTTTARIIARALNYTGPEGTSGPTTGPTDDCAVCRAIAEDRHPDVIEMDAASRTGIDDIREILDGVRYAPVSARYKIYIIDEVHMLSKAAFNALLKTLEEPPPHVKFIFATTEIRKVPVTVLSRCQRFDLRRIDHETLSAHFRTVCDKEQVSIEAEALSLIARAADGSVRDGLSLLDQAIATGGETVTGQQVQDMLGLADRGRMLDLLHKALSGDIAAALDILGELYRHGADASVVLQDILDLIHLLTRLCAVPQSRSDLTAVMVKDELDRAAALAASLSMPSLSRAWQIVLKGLEEVNAAPNTQAAGEMIIIRLAYTANLPDPARLIKDIQSLPVTENAGPPQTSVQAASGPSFSPPPAVNRAGQALQSEQQTVAQPVAATFAGPISSMEDIVELLRGADAFRWAEEVFQFVHLVRLKPGRLEIRTEPEAHPRLSQEMGQLLKSITGEHWMVVVSNSPGEPTLAQKAGAAYQARLDEARQHPVVAQIVALFPDATIRLRPKQDNEE